FCFSSRRRHTSFSRDWSSDVCSSDLAWTKWLTRVVQADELNMLIVRDIPLFYPSYLVGRRLQIPVGLDMAENYPAAVAAWGKSRSEERRVVKELISRGSQVNTRI